MTVRTDVTPASAPETARRRRLALVALALAALLAVMDGTIVAVALDTFRSAFDAPLTTVVWITVAYILAAAAVLPTLGWATARFGGRRVFLAGLLLFLLGSALAAAAWSAPSLIVFRVVQGVGGGLLEPSSLALAAALANKNNVGRVLGTMSMIINVAPVVGPIVGGLLLSTDHWQWIFIGNILFGALVLIAALLFIPADRRTATDPTPPAADLRGLTLLTLGFVAILFALNRSGQPGGVVLVTTAAIIGPVLLGWYVRHALTTQRTPALDLRLLRRPGFAAALATMGMVGFIMYSQLTSLPLFAADQHHLRGFDQGILVCALGLGLVVSMPAGARISDRTGPRPLVRTGSLITALGLATFALVHGSASLPAAFALFVGLGLCFGLVASPTFASVYRTLSPTEQAQGTTALFMTVQLAASLGVTVLGLLQSQVGEHWLTALFLILAGAALTATVASRALPGRPTA